MKKTIKLSFVDTPGGVDLRSHYFGRRIQALFDVVWSDEPDYIISLGYGHSHLDPKYDDCVKIFITGENDTPNFASFDYAMGHRYLEYGDRYIRHPIYAHWKGFSDIEDRRKMLSDAQLLNRGFCSIVVSSNATANPIREEFFRRLSKYKPVASGGKLWNNIGGPCEDKLAFCSKYKFNIAFENSSVPGYTTEKVMEAFAASTLPIYWGNPLVDKDFRSEAMITVANEEDIDSAIDEIVRLDKDDDAYLKICKTNCLAFDDIGKFDKEYDAFVNHIFSQDKESAKRLCGFGREPTLRKEFSSFYASYNRDIIGWAIKKFNGLRRRLKHCKLGQN